MADDKKKKMPPQLLEYFKNKNRKEALEKAREAKKKKEDK